MEYKLHLLLRPRRTYRSSSTGLHVAGSHQNGRRSASAVLDQVPSSAQPPKGHSRQNRLEHLTTQLLWRLQQSSPYHTSNVSDLELPKLPEAITEVATANRPRKLIAGLEESHGALYEIGVTDDGTFVGLTPDEMEESLANLRAMATSLGCNVEILRMVIVGSCEWEEQEETETSSVGQEGKKHSDKLWVAEALVKPDLSLIKNGDDKSASEDMAVSVKTGIDAEGFCKAMRDPRVGKSYLSDDLPSQSSKQQLRITLTGPTTGGKSTLLGTLSTSTLDNGRGKSRLSLLKHRHELASGITSSVAQELFGYKNSTDTIEVINYASGNVTSWNDVHAAVDQGRVVFVSDSAGHPRYRRTTVRGIVGWAPHWTFLCIAADDGESHPQAAGATSTAREVLGAVGASVDLSKAHLELCLKLEQPLVVVITKLDLATSVSLKQTLSKILTILKAAGRKPKLLPPDQTKVQFESELGTIPKADSNTIGIIVETMDTGDLKRVVPIVMISAAQGSGISMMHALLNMLPIPLTPTFSGYTRSALNPEQPRSLFHIEDVYGIPASYQVGAVGQTDNAETGTVVAGHMRFGSLSINDLIVIGPFDTDYDEDSPSPAVGSDNSPSKSDGTGLSTGLGLIRSHPSSSEIARIASRKAVSARVVKGEWYAARIVSIRNLRLPVQELHAGRVGTIGIIINPLVEDESGSTTDLFERPLQPSVPRIRKGMVLAVPTNHMIQTGHSLQSVTGLTASFEDGEIKSVTPGSIVVIYIASIRATARVLRLTPHIAHDPTDVASANSREAGADADILGLDVALEPDAREEEPYDFCRDGVTDVTLELMTHREWVELGSWILIMPGGGQGLYYGSERGEKGLAGLDGFVGRVVEVMD